VAGTVVLARATAACGDVHLRIEVTEVGGDGFAVATLCDAQDLGGIGLDADDEWFNGEAYLWLPSTGTYNVGLAGSIADAEALGAVDVYVDASPVVVDASALVDGDRSTLSALADVVVYLPDPAVTYRVAGADDAACAVEVWSGRPFPDREPRNLGACEHTDEIDFPPTDMTIPVVVFNRTGEETVIELTPS
jgi:hypothetical protein